jgi:hypothetical protein
LHILLGNRQDAATRCKSVCALQGAKIAGSGDESDGGRIGCAGHGAVTRNLADLVADRLNLRVPSRLPFRTISQARKRRRGPDSGPSSVRHGSVMQRDDGQQALRFRATILASAAMLSKIRSGLWGHMANTARSPGPSPLGHSAGPRSSKGSIAEAPGRLLRQPT